ncbi:MAG TPA: hypothetical protein VN041_02945 [Microbacterium sp.]|nr:hypothetical protein [Microbacterium sp.]
MTTETAPATPAPAAPEAPAQGATPDEPLGTPGLAALKSEREAKTAAEKRAAAAEARVKEFEDREKTEAQKQQEALAKAQQELAELTVAKTRAEVAAAKGVPVELLSGGTAEEIQAFAERLIAWRGEQPQEQQRFIVPAEGSQPNIPLNGDGLEAALKTALGIQ